MRLSLKNNCTRGLPTSRLLIASQVVIIQESRSGLFSIGGHPLSKAPISIDENAVRLAKNPLGIIALFIVMVHGFVCILTACIGNFQFYERIILIIFITTFPIMVLFVFYTLVTKHYINLFSPGDYKNEENLVKMQMSVVGSLAAATSKNSAESDLSKIEKINTLTQSIFDSKSTPISKKCILWVDDNPTNNIYERNAFEVLGIEFDLAISTNEALFKLKENKYSAIISDMGRKEGPKEGYVLLEKIRSEGNYTPLFFYAGSKLPEHVSETMKKGGQGCTNNPQELFEMVTKQLLRS